MFVAPTILFGIGVTTVVRGIVVLPLFTVLLILRLTFGNLLKSLNFFPHESKRLHNVFSIMRMRIGMSGVSIRFGVPLL